MGRTDLRAPIAALAATLAALAASGVHAATFQYDVVVTESIDVEAEDVVDVPRPIFDLPDLGVMGTVSITLEPVIDGLNVIADLPEFPTGGLGAGASIGGLGASLDTSSVFALDSKPVADPFGPARGGGVRLSNGVFSGITVSPPPGSTADQTLAGSFEAFGPVGTPAPVTLTDAIALLGEPDTRAEFSFNGTVNGAEDFVSFQAETSGVIPLPATGLLFLAGLGALAGVRRRRP